MNSLLGFTAFVGSLLLYLLVARGAGKRVLTHPDQFFLSKSNHDDNQFAASQISYALQMATVYPFFLFAFSGMWWLAVWNTIFYAVGIVLLYAVLPKFMKGHFQLIGSSKTLHGFIGNLHGAPKLRQFTACMSLVGFTGLAAFEIVWGARVLKVLFHGNISIYYLAIAILAFYLVLYLWLGGQRGTINTGQYQLVIAYVGIHAAVAWAILQPGVAASNIDAGIIVPLIILNGLVMLVSRLRSLRASAQASRLAKILSIITSFSLLGMLVFLLFFRELFSLNACYWKPIDGSSSEFVWQTIAFAILPLFFQFVDMTNWQRMASLAQSPSNGLLPHIRKGLRQYLIESPLSWLLPVLLGLCAAKFLTVNATDDPWDAFIGRVIAEPGLAGAFLSVAVVSGIAAIFLSTADGLLSAIGYSFTYDIHPRTRRMVDRQTSEGWKPKDVDYVVGRGRGAMAVFLGIIVAIFIAADTGANYGEKMLGLFLAFFAPMSAFAPAVIVPALTRRAASGTVAWLSIGTGAFVGIGLGIFSTFKGGIWQWLSIDASIAVSWIIYLVGFLFKRTKLQP